MQNVAYFWSFRCMHIFGGYSLTRYSYFARAEMVGISSLIPCLSYFHDRRVKPEIVQSCARNAIAQNLLCLHACEKMHWIKSANLALSHCVSQFIPLVSCVPCMCLTLCHYKSTRLLGLGPQV